MIEVDDGNNQFWEDNVASRPIMQHNADIMLFGKWSLSDVQVSDISLVVHFYINSIIYFFKILICILQ